MFDKKVFLTIKHQNNDVSGMLTEEVLRLVCEQTGLERQDVIHSIDWLCKIGIIKKHEATLH